LNFYNKIKSRFQSKDSKVLLENFISLSSLQIVGMVLPLITLPYVLRVLGFENYGIVVLAASLIAYFQSVTDFSFKITATRDVAVFKYSPKKLNLIYSNVLQVKGLFLLVSLLIIGLVVFLYPPFYEEKIIFILTTLMLLGHALFPDWFFQGIEKMKYITFLNIGIKLFFTICVFIFIKDKEDYWIYPLLQGAGLIGAGLVGQYMLFKNYGLKFYWLKPRRIKKTITSNFPIFVNQFFPTLYNNTSTFLLGIITGTYWVGIYDAIKRVVDICVTLLGVVSRVFFPFLNRRKDAFNKYKKLMLIFSSILVLIILLGHDLVFWYLNVSYEYAFFVLLILSLSVIGFALYDIFGLNYFIIRRQDKFVMKNTITASIIGFILAFPLISYFGIFGAAFNLVIARWLMGGRLWFKFLSMNNKFSGEYQ